MYFDRVDFGRPPVGCKTGGPAGAPPERVLAAVEKAAMARNVGAGTKSSAPTISLLSTFVSTKGELVVVVVVVVAVAVGVTVLMWVVCPAFWEIIMVGVCGRDGGGVNDSDDLLFQQHMHCSQDVSSTLRVWNSMLCVCGCKLQ